MQRHYFLLALACLAVSACDNKPKPKQEQMVTVSLPPPPPPKPRPTPPPVEQPPEQKVQEKQTIDPDPKPQMAKPEPPKPDEPPPGLGSTIKGDPDGFGLSGSGNDGRVGFGGHGRDGGGNQAGYYAGQVQAWIGEALRQDKRTRAANMSTKVKLWIDDSGRITRVEPGGGGNAAPLESVLMGMRLPARPPQGKT